MSIIKIDRAVTVACDVPFEKFGPLVKAVGDLPKIGGLKLPARAGRRGWETWVKTAREYTDKPLIYDHQKAGNDIPDTGAEFMEDVAGAGFDAVILFPYTSPVTQYEWIRAAQNVGLGVIVGGEMTHPRNLENDTSEGKIKGKDVNYTEIFRELGMTRPLPGYIREFAPRDIYELAAKMGVKDFVVPGNKPDRIRHFRGIIESAGAVDSSYHSPGFIAQGGKISDGADAAGKRFNAIVGRGIYSAQDIRAAALEHTSQI